ncbi:MAG: hypothetical protein WCE81_06035 [Halobacteriota archaeon]
MTTITQPETIHYEYAPPLSIPKRKRKSGKGSYKKESEREREENKRQRKAATLKKLRNFDVLESRRDSTKPLPKSLVEIFERRGIIKT